MRNLLATLAMFCLSVTGAMAQSFPDPIEIYVNDFGNLLSDRQEAEIRERLRQLREDQRVEFTVVTIRSMAIYDYEGAIEPFATGWFNHWGIGDASRDDGVMMLVSRDDRTMRIEVGRGYGSDLNAPMKRIIDETIIPYFRRDDYPGGILAGTDAVITELTGGAAPQQQWTETERELAGPVNSDPSPKNPIARIFERFTIWMAGVGAVIAGGAAWLFRRWRRFRPRICPKDGARMFLLEEEDDDVHLNDGQQTEERLKSVDYDVWCCPSCDHVRQERYGAWFSRLSVCRACSFKTAEGDSTTLRHATESSTGLRRIDYSCVNCGERWSVTKTIPRKSKSSSSGSSFGGGRSSGGGASGSW